MTSPLSPDPVPGGSGACRVKEGHTHVVTTRNGNHSTFHGGHFTPSSYSQIHCRETGLWWRSKARYVADLPNSKDVPL